MKKQTTTKWVKKLDTPKSPFSASTVSTEASSSSFIGLEMPDYFELSGAYYRCSAFHWVDGVAYYLAVDEAGLEYSGQVQKALRVRTNEDGHREETVVAMHHGEEYEAAP
jgi:hypothetical protein